MTPMTLPNKPPLAGDFDLGNGRYCRVTVTKVGSINGHVTYHAQAWQLDAQGVFVLDASGFPVRTPGTNHAINLSGLAARTHSRDPGWVKYLPPVGETLDPARPPEGWATGNGAPTSPAALGDRYLDLVTGQGWQWVDGEIAGFHAAKAFELAQILVERELDAMATEL